MIWDVAPIIKSMGMVLDLRGSRISSYLVSSMKESVKALSISLCIKIHKISTLFVKVNSVKKIQLALDLTDIDEAVSIAEACSHSVDIVEAGTYLCLSEGMKTSLPKLRTVFSGTILADIRVARAGDKFARLAFDYGADIVTVVGEAPSPVIKSACDAAYDYGRQIAVELFPGWSDDYVKLMVDLGVSNIVLQRTTKDEEENQTIVEELHRLAQLVEGKVSVSLAGGITPKTLALFESHPFDIAVVGSEIVKAVDPAAEANRIRQLLLEYENDKI